MKNRHNFHDAEELLFVKPKAKVTPRATENDVIISEISMELPIRNNKNVNKKLKDQDVIIDEPQGPQIVITPPNSGKTCYRISQNYHFLRIPDNALKSSNPPNDQHSESKSIFRNKAKRS